jgi:hypothetical protein
MFEDHMQLADESPEQEDGADWNGETARKSFGHLRRSEATE